MKIFNSNNSGNFTNFWISLVTLQKSRVLLSGKILACFLQVDEGSAATGIGSLCSDFSFLFWHTATIDKAEFSDISTNSAENHHLLWQVL